MSQDPLQQTNVFSEKQGHKITQLYKKALDERNDQQLKTSDAFPTQFNSLPV